MSPERPAFSRTLEYAARQRGETFDRPQYATHETVALSPLPCWKHLPEDTRKSRVLSVVAQVETEAAARRAKTRITWNLYGWCDAPPTPS